MIDLSQLPHPFAMRPGLARMGVGEAHFHALAPACALRAEKARAWSGDSAFLTAPRLDAATTGLALAAISAQMKLDSITPESVATNPMNPVTNGQNDLKIMAKCLSEVVEEDFAVLDARPDSPWRGGVPLMCVTCPSHWAPEDKIGLSLAAIHAPVADNAMLIQATNGLVQLATSGQRWQRWVWTITPSGRFDAHPKRHSARVWPLGDDAQAFAEQCFVRSERQTLFAVRDASGQPTGLAIFTIRVMLEPLVQAVRSPAHAHGLRLSLSSMSEAVLAYKGLTEAIKPILSWLSQK